MLKTDLPVENSRIKELDSFRGIAALSIVVFHYLMFFYNNPSTPEGVISSISLLQYGVHFFFIISGFVIYMTLEKTEKSFHFIINRFSRLFPAYWICLLLTTIVINNSPYYDSNLVDAKRFLISLTMIQHWFSVEDVDGSYWSLAVELCFYFLLFIVFVSKKNKNINAYGILLTSIIAITALLIREKIITQQVYYYAPILRFGTLFFAGILFYEVFKTGYNRKNIFYLAATLLANYFIASTNEMIMVVLFFVLMHLFVSKKLSFLSSKPLLFLGSISYPLFLLHQYAGYEMLNFLKYHSVTNPAFAILITIALMIFVASLITMFIEKPAMKFIRRKFIAKNN